MSYTLATDAHFGPSRAGLTLTAEFRNGDHTINGAGSATITDAGNGDYDCLLTVPDGFQGWFRLKNGATVLGSWALDPRETENADVKTSSLPSAGTIAAAVWAAATRTLSSFGTLAGDVWDVLTSGHQTTGSTGKALTTAGLAGDPWGVAVPGSYAGGTAGYVLGHNLDVPVSSRAPLGTVAVEVVSAGTVGGLLQLIIGATYTAAHGTALTHTLTSTDPDLSGATVTLEVGPHGGPPFLSAPVVVSGPTSAQVLTTELTSAGTGACPESRTAQWAYWADWGGTPPARVVLRGGPAFLIAAP